MLAFISGVLCGGGMCVFLLGGGYKRERKWFIMLKKFKIFKIATRIIFWMSVFYFFFKKNK